MIEDARRNVENRRVGLDGSTLALLAACFSRGGDLDDSPSASPRSLTCASCAPLVDAFRAISKREAADAAARAAAARFGGDASANDAMETDAGRPRPASPRSPRSFDGARRISTPGIGAPSWVDSTRGHRRARRRPKRAANEDDVDDSDDGGGGDARAAATRVSSTVYPWKSPNPRPRRRPVTSSRTPRAVTRRGRSRPRSLRRRGRGGASTSSSARWRASPSPAPSSKISKRKTTTRDDSRFGRTRGERRACGNKSRASRVWTAPTNASASRAGTRVGRASAAPFETATSLYQLFHARGVSSDDDDVRDALRRAAYGLLSSDALVQAAVVGLDASIADVDKVERALARGIAAADADDEADVSNFGTPAESAGLREDLAALFSTAGAEESSFDAVALGWALFFRYLLRLAAGFGVSRAIDQLLARDQGYSHAHARDHA